MSGKLVTLALGRFDVVLLDYAACLFGWASVWLCMKSLSVWRDVCLDLHIEAGVFSVREKKR